jgi:hypothetical protein
LKLNQLSQLIINFIKTFLNTSATCHKNVPSFSLSTILKKPSSIHKRSTLPYSISAISSLDQPKFNEGNNTGDNWL